MTITQEIKGNLKATIFIAVVFLLLVVAAYPQQRLGGKVVEVLDGKTVAVELFSGGRIVAELQHIEVPEAGQQLHQTVAAHLGKLVLGKNVEFRPLRIVNTRTIGQINLNGVDISQQMIRDGAAWYANEKTGQDAAESANYQSNEAQAKTEKRGVWSVKGLKPPQQLRAEAEEKRRAEAKVALETNSRSAFVEEMKRKNKAAAPRRQLNTEAQMFAVAPDAGIKLPENIKMVGGLLVGYNNSIKLGVIATPLYRLNLSEADGTRTAIQLAYLYYDGNENRGRQNAYLAYIESQSKDFKFLTTNNLVITADNQKFNIGKAKRFARKDESVAREGLLYEINKTTVAKIAKAENVSVKVGAYSWKLSDEMQLLISSVVKTVE